jgi:hypothetical protein
MDNEIVTNGQVRSLGPYFDNAILWSQRGINGAYSGASSLNRGQAKLMMCGLEVQIGNS